MHILSSFKIIIITVASLFMVISKGLSQENPDIWTAFHDQEAGTIGFKDAEGEVMISPRFMGFTVANKFEHIMAVMEEKEGDYISYYLTKSGDRVAHSQLYISDNSADCENEGFIRFEHNEKVGMLNKNGNIVVPAEYNALSRANNGLIVALKGSRKSFWEKHSHSGCNHYSWKGGKTLLIDSSNQVLIKKFNHTSSLDFYSYRISEYLPKDESRAHFKGVNGKYYSFIDFKLEFKDWLFNELLNEISQNKVLSASYSEIRHWNDSLGGLRSDKAEYLAKNYEQLTERLLWLTSPETDYFFTEDGINPFIAEGEEFEKYINNCGEGKYWQYPVLTIILNHPTKDDFVQDHYSFLRTDEGYKLFDITLRPKK